MTETLLTVHDLARQFRTGAGIGRHNLLRAVDGVSLSVSRGEVLAIVGESGSGKSTLARCVLGLDRPTRGSVVFDGVDVTHASRRVRRTVRRRMQAVFQDPYSSLDPRWTVERSVREALDAYQIGAPISRSRRAREVLDQVGLPTRFADRRPHELSGGQRQRVGLAAALAPGPDLLIADEPVTALDVSVQAQVLNLLATIQRELNLAVLMIAHDLSVVAHSADRIAVMYLGRIVESGPAQEILEHPRHPYTQALLAAVPRPDPTIRMQNLTIGEPPDAANPPSGCPFHPRCPLAEDRCQRQIPELLRHDSREVACLVVADRPNGSSDRLDQAHDSTQSPSALSAPVSE